MRKIVLDSRVSQWVGAGDRHRTRAQGRMTDSCQKLEGLACLGHSIFNPHKNSSRHALLTTFFTAMKFREVRGRAETHKTH